MQKFAALISYVGTRYCGWQKQKGSAACGGPSVQETFEGALGRITSEEVSTVGSGRTDSGVHAAGQVVHFILKRKAWDPRILKKGLNSLLPTDIRALDVRPVALEFHSQRSAVTKQYSYYFQQGPCALPPLEPYSWWIQKRLDLQAMRQGLNHLVGEHDFKPFQSSGSKPGPTERRILEAEITFETIGFPAFQVGPLGSDRSGLGLVRVRIVGTGFLKQMVRGIAGTLLQVGEGRRDPSCFQEILQTRDRTAVGPTAPGRALWLERVWYPEHFDLSW
ncbi:MAG: tRNA pseudouridine(38-40) synthase TruA [Oligoflexia bacterium]|nr:tRNA pseudouridine(38-40) synthase TruA [Oligoflexia bacterium]